MGGGPGRPPHIRGENPSVGSTISMEGTQVSRTWFPHKGPRRQWGGEVWRRVTSPTPHLHPGEHGPTVDVAVHDG